MMNEKLKEKKIPNKTFSRFCRMKDDKFRDLFVQPCTIYLRESVHRLFQCEGHTRHGTRVLGHCVILVLEKKRIKKNEGQDVS